MDLRAAMPAVELPESVRAVVTLVQERQLSVASAGVAYYAFNALLPTLVLAVLAVTASGFVAVAADELAQVAGVAPSEVRVVASAIREGAGFWRLAVLAGVVAAWSALQLGQAIAGVFRTVYGDTDHSWVERAADVVVVFLTWVVALVLVVVAGVVLAFVEPVVAVDLVWPVFLFAGLFVAFLPMYLVFPSTVTLRESVPGAAFAAGAWTLSGVFFRAYARSATSVELFGVVGVVLLLLTWLYVGSLALVVGAAANAVLAGRVADHERG